jgi:Tol biopolymer transport system component
MSTTILRPLRLSALAAGGLMLLAACSGGDGPTHTTPPLSVTVTAGRMERSSTITVSVAADGQTLAPTGYALSVKPADAAQVVDNTTVKLLKAGGLTITATANDRTGTATLTVAAPPVVVFDRVVNANRDIWKIDLDGQNLTQLTTDPGDDQDPTAAKATVVFVSYRSGNGDLWSVPLAGGANTRLTSTTRDENTPALSPDGQRLAYAYLATDISKVYVANADATSPQRAAPSFGSDGSIETYPAWAPASTLAFVATPNGTADIFEMVGSSAPSLLAGGSNAEVEPAWSPDGQTLAFVSNRTGSVEIFLLRVSTGAVTQLTSGAGSKSQPAWTPDGRLVYVETVAGVSTLRWVDPASPATSYPIDTGAGAVGHPAAVAAP